jgi:predicted outer membrane protein
MIPRRSTRPFTWVAGVSAVVLVALLAPAAPASAIPTAPPVPPETQLSNGNGVGAVTPADRDFVVKVRLAGLWEIPAGNMAQTRTDNAKVKQIGKTIAEQHVLLDKLTIEAAAKLGVALPDDPTPEQQAWLNEMKSAQGPQFDQVYTDRLRSAHGKIFPAIANIRSGTRNDVVRRLAQQANQFVMTHLTLLESSGLVDYGSLPAPPQPVAPNAAPAVDPGMIAIAKQGPPGGISTNVVLIVLAAALLAGVVSTMRIFRPR